MEAVPLFADLEPTFAIHGYKMVRVAIEGATSSSLRRGRAIGFESIIIEAVESGQRKAVDVSDTAFSVGTPVQRIGSDYKFKGWVVAHFPKRSGVVRYVIENADGLLFIMNGKQLKRRRAR